MSLPSTDLKAAVAIHRKPDGEHDGGTAIVLSGGGAKGDFEVGAVRCLYNQGIRPKILCGTSVGSVNALKLAEGETSSVPAPAGHVPGLAGLEKIWLSLSNDDQMWSPEPGVTALFNALGALPAVAGQLETQASQVQTASVGGVIASILGVPGIASFAPQLATLSNLSNNAQTVIATLTEQLADAQNIQGFINYDPLEKLMREPSSFSLAAQEASGILLRLAMVALEDGALRYVTEANTMIERDGSLTPVPAPPTPAQIATLEAEIKKINLEIAQAMAQGISGRPKLIPEPAPPSKLTSQLAALQRQLAQLQGQLQPDMIRSAIASSSLPLICRPTPMQDGRTYVDGGIRTLAPIQAAIDAGASEVYAVVGGSQKFDTQSLSQITTSLPLPLLGIAIRVGEGILPDEVARRDLAPDNPYPVPVVVIQPDPILNDDVHDGLTLEPGLIRIRMAYGYMRAYDTLHAIKQSSPSTYLPILNDLSRVTAFTDHIITLRKQAWALEFAALGKQFVPPASALPPAPYTIKNLPAPDQKAHDQVLALKAQIKEAVQARIAFYADPANNVSGLDSVPDGAAVWWLEWEAHSFAPSVKL